MKSVPVSTYKNILDILNHMSLQWWCNTGEPSNNSTPATPVTQEVPNTDLLGIVGCEIIQNSSPLSYSEQQVHAWYPQKQSGPSKYYTMTFDTPSQHILKVKTYLWGWCLYVPLNLFQRFSRSCPRSKFIAFHLAPFESSFLISNDCTPKNNGFETSFSFATHSSSPHLMRLALLPTARPTWPWTPLPSASNHGSLGFLHGKAGNKNEEQALHFSHHIRRASHVHFMMFV